MNTLVRKFPKIEQTYSRRQMLEMNILLMQAFFPENFTDKEIEILLHYCSLHEDGKPLLTKENKEEVARLAKLKSLATLNEYNKRLRNKYGLTFNARTGLWGINPVLYVPKDYSEVQLVVTLKQRNALAD